MKNRNPHTVAQPQPHIPGLTRQMVMEHAARLFRDVLPVRPLTEREWRVAEEIWHESSNAKVFETAIPFATLDTQPVRQFGRE